MSSYCSPSSPVACALSSWAMRTSFAICAGSGLEQRSSPQYHQKLGVPRQAIMVCFSVLPSVAVVTEYDGIQANSGSEFTSNSTSLISMGFV